MMQVNHQHDQEYLHAQAINFQNLLTQLLSSINLQTSPQQLIAKQQELIKRYDKESKRPKHLLHFDLIHSYKNQFPTKVRK